MSGAMRWSCIACGDVSEDEFADCDKCGWTNPARGQAEHLQALERAVVEAAVKARKKLWVLALAEILEPVDALLKAREERGGKA